MRFSMATLLLVILLATLVTWGIFNFQRVLVIDRQLALAMVMKEREDEFARQQIRLCELALTTKRDTNTMEEAKEKFQKIQQRYGRLQNNDPKYLSIVSIPEIVIDGYYTYSWRIYVPSESRVELAAHVVDANATPSNVFVPDGFSQPLPAGESVIKVVWKANDLQNTKASATSKGNRSPLASITVSLNENTLFWKSDVYRGEPYLGTTVYNTQEAIFGSDSSADLLHVASLRGSEALHVVVRPAKPNPAD